MDIRNHAGISTIGSHQSCNTVEAKQHQDNKKCQERIAQPILWTAIGGLALFTKDNPVEPNENILENAHGTDHGAIETPDQDGNQQNGDHHNNIEGEDCRQELHLGHPAEPVAQHSAVGGIEHQCRDTKQHHCCQNNSEVFKKSHRTNRLFVFQHCIHSKTGDRFDARLAGDAFAMGVDGIDRDVEP